MTFVLMSNSLWAQVAVLNHKLLYWTVWDRFMQVMYLGRAPRIKETLPDFLKWRRVTRHPLVFRGLTGSQRTPGFGASQLGIRAKVNDYLESSVGILISLVLIQASQLAVTPQTRGSVDYQSTCGIQVDVGLPDATSENWAESPLYGELDPNTSPA